MLKEEAIRGSLVGLKPWGLTNGYRFESLQIEVGMSIEPVGRTKNGHFNKIWPIPFTFFGLFYFELMVKIHIYRT